MHAVYRRLTLSALVVLHFLTPMRTDCLAQTTLGGEGGEAPKPATRTLDSIRDEMKKRSEGMGMSSDGMMGMGGGLSEKQSLAQLIQLLRNRLNSKKHKRADVEKQLKAALQQYFNADMEDRVRELEKVKAQLNAMESKLQRRLESESDIVELQYKQFLHKADGIEFNIPSAESGMGAGDMGSSGMPGGSGPGMGGSGMGGPGMGGPGMGSMGMGPGMSSMGGMRGGSEGIGYGGMEGGGEGSEGGMGSGMGEGMMGMDGPGMSMGYGGIGGEMSSDSLRMGYDASFRLTGVQRVDPNQLDESDPLAIYANSVEPNSSESGSGADNKENLGKILSALHQFEAKFHHFPRSASKRTKNQPPHSWRVAILPLIGRSDLYNEYRFDLPWDSEQNMQVANKMPAVFRTSTNSKNTTAYKLIVGSGAFETGRTPTRMSDITDGTSNTIAIIESNKEVVWTCVDDVKYLANGPTPAVGKSRLVGMADGEVKRLPDALTEEVLRALISRSGAEPAGKLD